MPIYVGVAVLLLSYTIFAVHFVLVIACWAKQVFVEVFNSLVMCHFVSLQAVSWIAVT
jgi:hypothetical protein